MWIIYIAESAFFLLEYFISSFIENYQVITDYMDIDGADFKF